MTENGALTVSVSIISRRHFSPAIFFHGSKLKFNVIRLAHHDTVIFTVFLLAERKREKIHSKIDALRLPSLIDCTLTLGHKLTPGYNDDHKNDKKKKE